MTTDIIALSKKARWSILAITFTQFVLLYLIDEFRDSFSNELIAIFYVIVIAVPTLAVLLLKDSLDKNVWKVVFVYALIMLGTSYYTGYQCSSDGEASCKGDYWFQYVAPQFIAWFILLFFTQTWLKTRDFSFSYTDLFNASWGNYITGKLTFLLVMIFWGLLALWAGLFNIIDIDFFEELFEEKWFLYPILGIATGIGVITFRTRINTIDLVLNILQVLIHWLLPVVAVMSLLFLMFLPFTGLQGLWDTGYATGMILWLVCILLFFTNSVYQLGSTDDASGRIYNALIKAALIASPAYVVLAAYGLMVRVDEYGWTVDRLWVLIIIVVLSAFTGTYTFSLIRRRDNWFYHITRINRVLAIFIAIVCLLVTSPIVDLRKISVADQVSKLKAGEVSIDEFDYEYLRFNTGRPGYEALISLKNYEPIASDKKQLKHIDNVLAARNKWNVHNRIETAEELKEYIKVYPMGTKVPEDLFQVLFENKNNLTPCFKEKVCFLLAVDIHGDDKNEYLLSTDSSDLSYVNVYGLTDKGWAIIGSSRSVGKIDLEVAEFLFEGSDFHTEPSEWKTLVVDDAKITFSRR